MFGDWNGMMFFGGWMMLLWVVILGLIIWAVIAIVRRSSSNRENYERKTPLDIARERYARGEITREEFEQIRKDLM